MRFNDTSGNWQAQPRSSTLELCAARGMQLWVSNSEKFLEDEFVILWVNAYACICNNNFHVINAA